jgi:O-antigen/teichoic acid export membrane protein
MGAKPGFRRTILKNASANLVRLIGSGMAAVLLPSFLVRMLPRDTYGAWALLLQFTLYVGFLDFGVQTAVARFVAHADELNDTGQRDGILSTAFVLLGLAGALGLLLIGTLAWQLPHILRAMHADLYGQARIALLLMGGSLALGLPVSVIQALFVGLQRNAIPAAIAMANRLMMVLLVVAAVSGHRGLGAMGAGVAAANFASYAALYLAWRTWAPHARITLSLVSRARARQIAGYSTALMVWMGGMLLVSGLDLIIVGIFDYKATAYYAVGATVTNFVAQAQGAIFSALLPASAVLGARGDAQRLGTLLVSSTRYGMLVLLAMALPLVLAGQFVLRLWVGADYALHSLSILEVLLLANVIRLCALPYATLLLGTGQQKKVILSPIAEGITNVVSSVGGAYLLGAIGVAIGTLIGAFVSVGFHLLYNMPRTASIAIDRFLLVQDGLLRPLTCAAPVGLVLAFRVLMHGLPPVATSFCTVAGVIVSIWLLWNYGLFNSERQTLQQALRMS